MKIVVYTDIHRGAPHWTGQSLKDFLKDKKEFPTFLTGDIFDLKNTPKKILPEIEEEFEETSKVFGDDYVWGNHECEPPNRYYHKWGDVLFCHGHTLFWSEDKVKKWEQKKIGKGKLRYFIYRLRHLFSGKRKKLKPSKKLIKKIQLLCVDYGCNTFVFGHTHRYYDEVHNGIRIINCPQGRTEIIL